MRVCVLRRKKLVQCYKLQYKKHNVSGFFTINGERKRERGEREREGGEAGERGVDRVGKRERREKERELDAQNFH